ncbi:hypothetical protein Trco_005750 [Trichoderma cornu-damae]|uniref:Uncharacterized protein n=1 Tax=Trichoderma cornu-damae TaxID=654480 RepID=A0A9P8QQD8_9HYPO|nr:hypothetical protein Trco_005750 [Trichoderma cornu-damae]
MYAAGQVFIYGVVVVDDGQPESHMHQEQRGLKDASIDPITALTAHVSSEKLDAGFFRLVEMRWGW